MWVIVLIVLDKDLTPWAARKVLPCCRARGLTTVHTFLPRSTIDVEIYLACLREPKTIRPFEIVGRCGCFSNLTPPRSVRFLPLVGRT
jgi:hypothetical protein